MAIPIANLPDETKRECAKLFMVFKCVSVLIRRRDVALYCLQSNKTRKITWTILRFDGLTRNGCLVCVGYASVGPFSELAISCDTLLGNFVDGRSHSWISTQQFSKIPAAQRDQFAIIQSRNVG